MTAATATTKLERGVDYDVREGAPASDELAFILDSWRWCTLCSPPARGVPRDVHFVEMTKRVLAVVARSRVKVAFDVLDPTTLIGWCVIEGPVLHYVLVRKDQRRQGVARALLEGEHITQYSAKTMAQFRGAPAGWTYNPWAFVPTNGDT